MPNPDPTPVGPFDSFEGLFERAEERPAYWLELGKLEFTEEMLARMKERGITKGQLAVRLQAAPAFVTRLVSGRNNFTLATMVPRGAGLGVRVPLPPPARRHQGRLDQHPQRPPPARPRRLGRRGVPQNHPRSFPFRP